MGKRRRIKKKTENIHQSSIKVTKENIKNICPRKIRIVLERIDLRVENNKTKDVRTTKPKTKKTKKQKKVVPFYNISAGDIVWTKLRGYSAWPATVIYSNL